MDEGLEKMSHQVMQLTMDQAEDAKLIMSLFN
jgi:hypothetical protein